MADKAFPIYFNWNDMMREYLDPASRCMLMDALQDFYENGVDPIPNVPEELRFPLALMIDCINIKRTRSAEMAERGRRGASKRYGADDDDEPKQSDSNAMAQPSQSDNHYNNNNNKNGNDNNITPSNEGDTRAPAREKRFVPPSMNEVRDYATANGLHVDAEAFCDHYTGNGWKVGRNAMKDWRAAVRNWARRDGDFGRGKKPKREGSYDTDEFVLDALKQTYGVGVTA